MNVAIETTFPQRIRESSGDGFVAYSIAPAGLRASTEQVVRQLFGIIGTGVLLVIWFRPWADGPNAGSAFMIGFLSFFMALYVIRVLMIIHHSIAGRAAITIGDHSVIVRSWSLHGVKTVPFLRAEIGHVSHGAHFDWRRLNLFHPVSAVSRLQEEAVWITTRSGDEIPVLSGYYLFEDDIRWLVAALRRSLELP